MVYTYESSLCIQLFNSVKALQTDKERFSKTTWQNRTNVFSTENIKLYGDLLLVIEVLDFQQRIALNKVPGQ